MRERTYDELEAALKIDEYNLDDNIIKQPELFRMVSEKYKMEVSRRDAAKQALNEALAEADAEIREAAADSKERVMEADIKSQIQLHRSVRAAKDDLHVLTSSTGQWESLEKAYEQRMKALDLLVRLHGSQYFSTPTKVLNAQKNNTANFAKTEMNRMRVALKGKRRD
jgi:hypothetical protein